MQVPGILPELGENRKWIKCCKQNWWGVGAPDRRAARAGGHAEVGRRFNTALHQGSPKFKGDSANFEKQNCPLSDFSSFIFL